MEKPFKRLWVFERMDIMIAKKIFFLTFIIVLILIIISLLVSFYISEKKQEKLLSSMYNAPTQEIVVENFRTDYTDISDLNTDSSLRWYVTDLKAKIHNSNLYIMNDEGNLIGNIFAISYDTRGKIYVSNPELVPKTISSDCISDVSICINDKRYFLYLTKDEIEFLQNAFRVYYLKESSEIQNLEKYRFNALDSNNFTNTSYDSFFYFHVKGIDGLCYYLFEGYKKNVNDDMYYLQCTMKDEYLLLPDTIQAKIQKIELGNG